MTNAEREKLDTERRDRLELVAEFFRGYDKGNLWSNDRPLACIGAFGRNRDAYDNTANLLRSLGFAAQVVSHPDYVDCVGNAYTSYALLVKDPKRKG